MRKLLNQPFTATKLPEEGRMFKRASYSMHGWHYLLDGWKNRGNKIFWPDKVYSRTNGVQHSAAISTFNRVRHVR